MKKLSVTPTRKESVWAIVYMLLEFLVLPTVISLLNSLLPNPLSTSRLNLAFFLLNYAAVGLILRKFIGRNLLETKPGLLLGSAVLGMMAYWAMNLAMGMLILGINPEFANVNDAAITDMVQDDMLFSILGTVVLVPPCEELLFRGVVFGGLYNRRPVMAYVISMLCFSAVHVVGYIGLFSWDILALCFLQYLPAGICLAWSYARSGSILTPILIHTLVNATGVALMR